LKITSWSKVISYVYPLLRWLLDYGQLRETIYNIEVMVAIDAVVEKRAYYLSKFL
jgi:hypothetical protein